MKQRGKRMVQVWMTSDEFERLTALAKKANCSLAAYMRYALNRSYLVS